MSAPDPYKVLGLAESATQEEIKRRYRELARLYHPDVARTSDATARFTQINEANRVLSDPARRKAYDSQRNLERARERDRAAAAAPGPRAATSSSRGPGRPSGTARPGAATEQGRPTPSAAERAKAIDWSLEQARQCAATMRYREAEAYCREALRLNPRCAAAFEQMGDCLKARGQGEEAIAMYTYAVQLDPSNRALLSKVERMATPRHGRPLGDTIGVPVRRSHWLVIVSGMATLVALFIWLHLSPMPNPTWLPFEWEWTWVLGLTVSGVVAGLVLTGLGAVPGLRDEALHSARRRHKPPLVPVAAMLCVAALAWYPAAAALWCILSVARVPVPRSILPLMLATTILVLCSAGLCDAHWERVLLGAGSLVFPGALAGWALAQR